MSNFCKEGNLSVTLRWGGLCKHFCCGKAISIIYSECVFVELVIQHAVRMHLIVICDLSDSTISFQVTSWTARFRGDVTENKMLFWFSLQSVSDIFLSLIFFKWSQLGAHYFLIYLFKLLYMFRSTMCPSSGEPTVSMQHWYFSFFMGGCLVCRKKIK